MSRFSQFVRMMSHVPRWTIIRKNRQQNIAEHTFYVTYYLMVLIEEHMWYWSPYQKYAALQYALVHDMAEARMSDIPGPVKRSIRDPLKFEQIEHDVLADIGVEDIGCDDEIKALVKVADLIDEFFFISEEVAMGNKTLDRVHVGVSNRLQSAIAKAGLPASIFAEVDSAAYEMHNFNTWSNNDDVKPSVTKPDDEYPF